jgi:hypothetical protein
VKLSPIAHTVPADSRFLILQVLVQTLSPTAACLWCYKYCDRQSHQPHLMYTLLPDTAAVVPDSLTICSCCIRCFLTLQLFCPTVSPTAAVVHAVSWHCSCCFRQSNHVQLLYTLFPDTAVVPDSVTNRSCCTLCFLILQLLCPKISLTVAVVYAVPWLQLLCPTV